MAEETTDIGRYLANLEDELNGAVLYDAVASAEKNPQLSEIYARLAEVERKHAETFRSRLLAKGVAIPAFRPSWRTRILSMIARRFGANAVLPSVTSMEQIGIHKYANSPDDVSLDADERSHARILRHITRTSPGGIEGSELARIEGRHRGTQGNALRAAVLGANDGLVSNLSLVMGVAGAALSSRIILVTGVAGVIAGASSMALGEWLSVQSSRELYKNQLEAERLEIAEAPEEEAEELALIYQSRGLSQSQARSFANQIMSNQDTALETMAREELGIDPGELGGSAWVAAFTSFILFAGGAIVPVIPFTFLDGQAAVLLSVALSTAALFVVGAGITLYTGRPVLFSGSRQVAFGLIAAALTFAIGKLIGVTVAG